VDDYCKRFMSLSCRDPVISESHQIQLFTAGLGKPLCTDVSMQKPEMLNEAIMYARAYEQRDHKPQVLAALMICTCLAIKRYANTCLPFKS
jgi:hypothetical protein